jgi:TetR/AcrR family transcriptional regulator, regulator of mycofactocin system
VQVACAYHRRVTVDVADVDGEASGSEATTRRRKRDQVRARVERVALDLFRQYGFQQVTVERIAAEAGVGPTTFYRYFGTKDGVLFGYQSRWLKDVRAAVEGLDVDRSRAEQVVDLLAVLGNSLDAELETMQLRDEIVARNPTLLPRTLAVQRAWEHELAGSLARRRQVDASDLTAQADAAAVQLLVRLAFRRWRAGACASVTEGVAAAMQDMMALAAGWPAEKGRPRGSPALTRP